MKRSEPESVSELLKDLLEENSILRLAEVHEELHELWKAIPDPTFARLSVEVRLSTDGVLEVVCPSSVALNYVRLSRPLLESHLSHFISKHGIKKLIISLAN